MRKLRIYCKHRTTDCANAKGGTYPGINIRTFFPEQWTFDNYKRFLFNFKADTVAQFPKWFMNTLITAIFTCLFSTSFVLMVAYATSCMRFKMRKPFMNIGIILGMFPGVLAMIAVYFVLKSIGLTNSHVGMVLVYSAGSGLGYLIVKGFFDTISVSLREAAKLEGASEATIFLRIVLSISILFVIMQKFYVEGITGGSVKG